MHAVSCCKTVYTSIPRYTAIWFLALRNTTVFISATSTTRGVLCSDST